MDSEHPPEGRDDNRTAPPRENFWAAAPAPAALPPAASDPMSGLVPYKNKPALTAYYLAVFSIIPCLGVFLGIAAFVLGLKGLQYVKQHPEARGTVHAWIGVIVGGFFGFGYLIGLGYLLVLSQAGR